jgi:3-methyladenine DNA glycosylase AlkD
MQVSEIIDILRSYANPDAVNGMARFGINPDNTLGISMPVLRKLASQVRKDHSLAHSLWESGIHEARILAALVDDPKSVSIIQMDNWVKEFDSWDVCDQVCMNLFCLNPHAFDKAVEWSQNEQEFIKRAGFALMASLSLSKVKAIDDKYVPLLAAIEKESWDGRNYVKKAVNWALRQIGKRNLNLNKLAIAAGKRISLQDSKSARWIAADALRELTSDQVISRLGKKSS